jgi:drug/metabolite transporter (DMT)-like permease
MAAYAVAFYRYGLSALVLFPLLLRLPVAQVKTAAWGMMSGVSVGLGWIGFVSALKTVPVSTVGVLYMTYPVFTLLIGWIWFRDVPSKRGMTGALMVIMAALIASSPDAVESRHLPAMLISLTAPIGFGIGINILIHKLPPINAITRVTTFTLGASLSLLPLMILAEPQTVLPQNSHDWQLIGGLALFTALLPQLIYTSFAPMIGAARSSVAGSVELPTMFFISWYTLGEVIGVAQWLACLLITMAILLTPARATRNLTTQMVLPRKVQ